MKKINVMMTCAGGTMGYENIMALKTVENVEHVIAADSNPKSIARKYGCPFYCLPPANEPDYINAIRQICLKEQIGLIIPGADEEALLLAAHDDELRSENILCAAPPKELVSIFRDKNTVFDYLKKQGVDIPRHYLVNNLEELNKCLKVMGYPQKPLLVKPYVGRGGRGVWELREDFYTFEELSTLREMRRINLSTLTEIIKASGVSKTLMVMEYFPGDIYDVDILAKDGEPLCLIPRKRHHWLNIPFYGFTFDDNPAVLCLAEDVCRALKFTHLFDIDVVLDQDGKAKLVDVNPRLSGSAAAVKAGGINLFELLIKFVLGEDIPKIDISYGREVKATTKALAI